MLRDGQVAMFGARDEVLQALQKAQNPQAEGSPNAPLSNSSTVHHSVPSAQAQAQPQAQSASPAPNKQPIKTMTVAAMPVVPQRPKSEGNPS
jgi:ABC-type protease/lipase transport system fused ATPase/permease subunit